VIHHVARGIRMGDSRACWLSYAVNKIFAEIDPDAELSGIVVGVRTAEGTVLHYTLTPWEDEVQRYLVPPEAGPLGSAFKDATVDITPESGVAG